MYAGYLLRRLTGAELKALRSRLEPEFEQLRSAAIADLGGAVTELRAKSKIEYGDLDAMRTAEMVGKWNDAVNLSELLELIDLELDDRAQTG